MRILFYTLNYAPEITGTGKYTGEMAEWLASRGHYVEVIAAPPHYPAWRIDPAYRRRGFHQEHLNGVRVFRVPVYLPEGRRIGTRERILLECSFTISSARYWLPRLLGRTRYDVIVSICPPLQSAVPAYVYSRLRHIPYVIHVQDLQVDAAVRLGMIRNAVIVRALYGLEKKLLRYAAFVTTITEAMRVRLHTKGVGPDRTAVIPNWADLREVTPGPRMNRFRAEVLHAGAEHVVVMYAGNMGEKQGLEVLLDAAELLRFDRRIRWVLVGDGVARDKLIKAARMRRLENVIFLAPQPREVLGTMLTAADIQVVIQRNEAADLVMPSKLTNVMAAGRASIVTASPGTTLHRLVTEAGIGLAVPPDDPRSLAEAVLHLAASPDARMEMGARARAYAERHFSQDAIMERFEEHLRAVVRTGSSAAHGQRR